MLQMIDESHELTAFSNKFGICGLGPDFCGADVCVAGCDSKAECDPGFGSEWSEKSGCPLNVCCSKFGFCGVTKEFCGNKTVTHKTCSKDGYLSRVVGYYEGWSTRRACNQFWPEQIPLGVYSHINFAFATIDPETYEVLPADEADAPLYERLTTLKQYDPDLKVMIALGGWTFNDPGPTATIFSDIAASEEKQKKFFKSLVSFMSTHDFDGVDLDWEYPEADDRNGKPADYGNFPKFLANLKSTLDKTPGRNELSITLPASYWYLQHFDLKKLGKHVSFFNIMTYDMHGTWDRGNKWTGEYLNAHTNLTEIKNSLDLLWRNDVKAEQVVMGLAFYGRAYTVASPSCVEPGCLYLSGSVKADCSYETGILLNSEIVGTMTTKSLSPKLYKDAAVKVTHWDNQWVSYDDKDTFKMKADFAREQCLGGVMVWAISHDTKNATFTKALAQVSNRRIIAQRQVEDQDHITDTTNYDTCKWSNCGEACPAGWQMIPREDQWRNKKDEYMLDTTGCNGVGFRSWCCPPTKAPKCGWYSFNNGHCESQCPSGMVEIGSTRNGCKSTEFDYQAACCTIEDDNGNELTSMTLYSTSEWAASPHCDTGVCSFKGTTMPDILVQSGTGSGGVYCMPGNVYKETVYPKHQQTERKLCYNKDGKPPKWDKCQWHNNIGLGKGGQRCWSGCPDDTVRVAMNTYNNGCYARGGEAFCCNANYYTESTRLSDDLQNFQDAVDAWIKDPGCASSSSSKSLSTRDSKCDRDILVFHLAQILTSGISSQDHWETLAKIWDDVAVKYAHLAAKTLMEYFSSEDKLMGAPKVFAGKVLDQPNTYDLMIAGDKNFISCDEDLCKTLGCDDEDDEALARRHHQWGEQRDVLRSLEKRGPAELVAWYCTDSAGKTWKIEYWKHAYPSRGAWKGNERPMREGVSYSDQEQCANCDVSERQITKKEKRNFTTEHIVELQSIPMFFDYLVKNSMCGVDCAFFLNYFMQDVLVDPPTLPGGNNFKTPVDRIMESLGSDELRENFRLLNKFLNELKGQLWRSGIGEVNSRVTNLLNDKDLAGALSIVRGVVSVFNYMNLPKVWRRYKQTNILVRQELERIQNAYKAASSKDVKLLQCWDLFLYDLMKSMAGESRQFVVDQLAKFKNDWVEGKKPGDEDWLAEVQQVQDFVKGIEKQLDKISINLKDLF
ncbi:hypothetical protein ABOM_012089 [Aspergillus bombycis]|uniref:chitinase n=1 Tax=Aspergillus bombycis TaxID=109264 RepID=A0A1F7ZK77_9EURO|nr:hypothetical protein ABOM_012089 [Aspergillus bombycis]OGM39528.1 hypothetical protein ABOM_012089 [Aspergillus bombycis]